MEKTFTLGVSALFGAFAYGMAWTTTLFGQIEADTFTKIITDCGIASLLAVVFYKIIGKIIDVFGKAILDRVDRHDAITLQRLDELKRSVDAHLAGTPAPTSHSLNEETPK